MEFNKVVLNDGAVELHYDDFGEKKSGLAVVEKGEDPQPTLGSALRAFKPFVLWALSAPESWGDTVEVRAVTIKRPEDEPRGIVVSCVKRCPRARNGVAAFNTPYLSEHPSGADSPGFLPGYVPALIDALEQAAEKYHQGARGEQTDLSDNSKDFAERAASASAKSTRKPKGGKKGDEVVAHNPGVGMVWNPDSTEPPLDDNGLRQLLLMVERDVPIDAIARWTSSERAAAQQWGSARQQELAGTPKVKVPTEPPCLARDATLPLPVKPTDDGIAEIQAAKESGN